MVFGWKIQPFAGKFWPILEVHISVLTEFLARLLEITAMYARSEKSDTVEALWNI